MLKLSVALRRIAARTGYQLPSAVTSWVALTAADIGVIIGALNRYLRNQVTLSEAKEIDTGKNFSEQIAQLSDDLDLAIEKGLIEEAYLLEAFKIVLEAARYAAESISFSDSQFIDSDLGKSDAPLMSDDISSFDIGSSRVDAFAVTESHAISLTTFAADGFSVAIDDADLLVGKGFQEALSLAESQAISVSAVSSDAVSIAEDSVFSVGLAKNDTAALTDELSRTVVFNRDLTDGFTIDDLIGVAEQHVETKANIFGVSDSPALSFSRPVTGDSFGFTDSLAYHVFEGAKALGGKSLNAAPLN